MGDPTSYQAIGWIAVAVFSLVGGLNQILKLFRHFREEPPPVTTYATKIELERLRVDLHKAIETLSTDGRARAAGIYSRLDSLRLEVKDDQQRIHERTDEILAAVSELRGKVT